MGGQSSYSFVPSVIKTNVPLDSDDRAHKDLPLQRYGERIEKLSQQDRLSKFCMDAGFLNVVEIGQYFMTNDTAEFSQFRAAACRHEAGAVLQGLAPRAALVHRRPRSCNARDWALMGAGENCHEYMQDTSPHSFSVRWLPPHRGSRSVEASLVELSLKTHLSVAMNSLL